jgi:TldD protein
MLAMPLDDNKEALRHAVWRLTDARYREAVKQYHLRKADAIHFDDENKALPSFQAASPLESMGSSALPALSVEAWKSFVRETSLILRRYPAIQNHRVRFIGRQITKIFIDSEGRRLSWKTARYTVSGMLWMLGKDGRDFTLRFSQTTGDPKELPSAKAFQIELKKRIALLHEIAQGEALSSYAGPVLLAPIPAGVFFHEALGHRLEGNRLLSDNEGRTFHHKLGQKITFEDVTVYDDPSAVSYQGQTLIGHYAFDDEGTKAQRASLVSRGVLRGFLTTRAPLQKRGHLSNGHARNQSHERPISRMGNLFIEAHQGKSWSQLKQLLLEEVRRRKLPYGIILLEVEGGETGTNAYNFQAFSGEIMVAKKLLPDGSEQYINGVDFVGTPLNSLSQILALGDSAEVDNSFCGAESGYIPVSTISPAVLLSWLELQSKKQTRVTQYVLPIPK